MFCHSEALTGADTRGDVMANYKAVVVGCGQRSQPHIQAYDLLDGAEIVACCDPVTEAREERAREFGIAPYADTEEMIRQEKPDIVHLVTWQDTRVPLMTLVSDLGVPACTVEKPIAVEVRDWNALCELERASSTKFAVSHQYRWHPHLSKCIEAVRSGQLGDVLFLDLSSRMNVSAQGTHLLHYGMAMNGDYRVARVFGNVSDSSEMDWEYAAPCHTEASIQWENGARGLWLNSPTAPTCGLQDQDYSHVRVAAYCERGRVCWEEFGHWQIVSPDGIEEGDWGGTVEEHTWNNLRAQAAFHKSVIRWMDDDNAICETSLERSLHEWKAVLALYASALWRKPVDLVDFNPPETLWDDLRAALDQEIT
jgi:predicted dehydrogenase